jgi:Uri superfamily endonuclease
VASGQERRVATYQLLISVDEAMRLRVGRLGTFEFPAGYYIYTGSALRGMAARLKRHLSREKRLRWHIDYLLASPHATVVDIVLFSEPECVVNQRTTGAMVAPGFGASDCRAGCGAHLFRVGSVNWEVGRLHPNPPPRCGGGGLTGC